MSATSGSIPRDRAIQSLVTHQPPLSFNFTIFNTRPHINIYNLPTRIFVECFIRGPIRSDYRSTAAAVHGVSIYDFGNYSAVIILKKIYFFRVIIFRTFLHADSLTGLYLKRLVYNSRVFSKFLIFLKKARKGCCNFSSKSHCFTDYTSSYIMVLVMNPNSSKST